jgi:hypothetical protein
MELVIQSHGRTRSPACYGEKRFTDLCQGNVSADLKLQMRQVRQAREETRAERSGFAGFNCCGGNAIYAGRHGIRPRLSSRSENALGH